VGTFSFALKSWLVVLVLCVIPVYVSHGLSGYLMYMTPGEIATDVCLMMTIGAMCALVIAGLTAASTSILPGKAGLAPEMVSVAAAATMGLFFVLRALKLWLETILHSHFPSGGMKVLALAACAALLVVLIKKVGAVRFRSRLSELVSGPAKLAAAMTSAALVVVLYAMIVDSGPEPAESRVAAAASHDGPNVILITIDTLAAEDMSLYGYGLDTSPAIARFAEQSYVFDHAFANSNFTTPAIASILTGRYEISHGIYQLYGRLRTGGEHSLPGVLRANGYRAAGIVSSAWAHPRHVGLGESFDYSPAPVSLGAQRTLVSWLLQVPGANLISTLDELFVLLAPVLDRDFDSRSAVPPHLVYEKAEAYLRTQRGKGPVFLWTHVSPPHEPYLSPPPFAKMFLPGSRFETESTQDFVYGTYPERMQPQVDELRLRYDEYVAYTDYEVGRYLGHLRESGYLENSLIILTADHGQSFERGYYGHAGPQLYQPLIHIPLLIHLPGQTHGRRVASYAEQVDIPSTVLDLVGVPVPTAAQGESLRRMMQNQGMISTKPKFASNYERNSTFEPLKKGTVAVMQNGYKYIYDLETGTEELYALDKDGREAMNVVESERAVASSMRLLARSHVSFGKRQDPVTGSAGSGLPARRVVHVSEN
jgi:arylsulfatase A-like enzyme